MSLRKGQRRGQLRHASDKDANKRSDKDAGKRRQRHRQAQQQSFQRKQHQTRENQLPKANKTEDEYNTQSTTHRPLPILLVGVVWFTTPIARRSYQRQWIITANYASYLPDTDKLFDKSAVEELSDDNLLDTLRRYINRVEIFSGKDKLNQEESHYIVPADSLTTLVYLYRPHRALSILPQESWPNAKLRGVQERYPRDRATSNQ